MIEIELAGHPNEQNPVIQTNIKRENSKCSYFINGSPSNKKRIMELAKSYSIQIDNLCQFLPQDKVVEFAAMTPVELLKSTQRAVASEEMLEWHEELKKLRHEQRTTQAQKVHEAERLVDLEKRHKGQEADVERLREREQVKRRVEMLKGARPFAEYRAAKTRYQEAKDQRKEAYEQLQGLKSAVEPTLRAVNSKQLYQDKMKKFVEDRSKLVTKADQRAANEALKIDHIQSKLDDLGRQVSAEVHGIKNNKAESARLEGVIRGLKKQLEEKPISFDVGALNVQIVSCSLALQLSHADQT
jgi:chromosome segregation ATPase